MTWRDVVPWDVIEFGAKTVASLGIGLIAILKLGRRAAVWLTGPRVQTTLRIWFKDEIALIDKASTEAGECRHWQQTSDSRLDAIDRDLGLVVDMVAANSDSLRELVGLFDQVLGNDRRDPEQRVKALSDLRERAIARRADRRIDEHKRASETATDAPAEEPPPAE